MEGARIGTRDPALQRMIAVPQRARSTARYALLALALGLFATPAAAVWTGFGDVRTGCNGTVFALATLPDGSLVAGGSFSECDGTPASNIARWDGVAWTSLGFGASNGVDGQVRALTVIGGALYVGGGFAQAGGTAANRVARWDGVAWSSLGTGASNGVSGNATVLALTAIGGDLYVGGNFTQAGGAQAGRVARWDGVIWSPLGSGTGNGVSNTVYALHAMGSDLYVGGAFVQAGGASANRVARWNGAT